jgi:NDP-sugar pyrophosphorylase family protein
VAASAKIEDGVALEGPCFIDEEVVVKTGARIGAYTVLGRKCEVGSSVNVETSILWPSCAIGEQASLSDVVLGQGCYIAPNAVISGVTLGDKAVVPDPSSTAD